MERHFNVTVYVFSPSSRKFLFIKHKKLGKWLPPGGHIEANERPDVAGVREVIEETGIDVHLEGERFPREIDIVRPFGIQLNVIDPEKHEHMDVVYLAVPTGNEDEKINTQETTGIGWFAIEEIENESFDTFRETKMWCRRFYEMR